MNYEINFLILQSQTKNADEIRGQIKKLITAHDGEITDELIYQKRKLAYEINHEQYGFYTVYRFDLEDGEKLKDLTKVLNLEKGLVRHIIVKSSEIPELQKEIGKTPKTEEERKAEAIREAPKKKIGKNVLDEITKEGTKTVPMQTETKMFTAKKESVPTTEKKVVTKKNNEGESITKKTKLKSDRILPKKTAKKEEISMEDLDKKLDEILNI